MTADDAVTILARTPNPAERLLIITSLPTRLLREVADLTYATSYPDTDSRRVLIRGIHDATS